MVVSLPSPWAAATRSAIGSPAAEAAAEAAAEGAASDGAASDGAAEPPADEHAANRNMALARSAPARVIVRWVPKIASSTCRMVAFGAPGPRDRGLLFPSVAVVRGPGVHCTARIDGRQEDVTILLTPRGRMVRFVDASTDPARNQA